MHEVEGATWCEPRRRDGRLRQSEASPVCAQSRGCVRSRHRHRRERRRRGAEDRGGHGDAVACDSRSCKARRRDIEDVREHRRRRLQKRQASLDKRGFEGGLPPSELAKGVQGETAAIGRVSLYPFLYAAPRAAGRGR